ncbi:hypothetical protein AURDEDRAFT_156652 [Auricularia subglabra TFB-10046 SS5]|nr:hypothetical protein AURDEDRAFT_156652 [Auricularia subglabra TFB-10046 SS5]
MSTPLESPHWSPWTPSIAQAPDGTKMGVTGSPGSTSRPRSLRSVRSVEILPAIPEDVFSGQILPAELPLPAAANVPPSPSPSRPPSLSRSPSRGIATPPPMPSPTVTEILAMSGVHGASARDSAVRDLAHLLRQSRAREEALRVQLQQSLLIGGGNELVLPDTNDLVARLASTEALLLKKEVELREYRAQGLTLQQVQDPNDADEVLLSAFDELNGRVKALAQRIRDSLGWSERSTVIDHETLRRLRDRNAPAFTLVRHFLGAECAAGHTLGDVAEPIARALLSAVLCDLMFMPFAPGCDTDEHEAVCALFKRIAANEPRDKAARWRASTYRALRAGTDDGELLDYVVKTFFQALYDVCASAARGSPALRRAGVFSELRGEATGVARAALRWRDDAADREYEAFCPWPLLRLDASEFRSASSYANTGEVVMLATSLGLRAIGPPSAYKPHASVAVRAAEGLSADVWRLRKLADEQMKWENSSYAESYGTYRTGWVTTSRY